LACRHWPAGTGLQKLAGRHWPAYIGLQTLASRHWPADIGLQTLACRHDFLWCFSLIKSIKYLTVYKHGRVQMRGYSSLQCASQWRVRSFHWNVWHGML